VKKELQIKIPLDDSIEDHLNKLTSGWTDYLILKKSVDARNKSKILLVYFLEVYFKQEVPEREIFELNKVHYDGDPIIVIGSGPAGLFAALRLCEQGVPVKVLEQGSETKERILKINKFWRYGELDETNNTCFGEGGAGLFSDGKLITRIKSPFIPYVMRRLVEMGAPEEIEYLANPHVGSDKIRRLIPYLRQKIEALGGVFLFKTQMLALLVEGKEVVGVEAKDLQSGKVEKIYSPAVILATGHSANSVYEHLKEISVEIQGQSFAVGLRVEHPRTAINLMQYGEKWDHEKLETANYKLSYKDTLNHVGVYSFCMCPGGYVLNTSTQKGQMVCNGMSNYKRNSAFSNSAVVVSVDYEKHFGTDAFAGLRWRTDLEGRFEKSITDQGGIKELPAQKLNDLIANRTSFTLPKGSSLSGALPVNLAELLPKFILDSFIKGMENFNTKMKGFASEDCLLYGIESRTSAPLRIVRDKDSLQSTSHPGLYPAGEGAGYAGGITSSACDGVRIADKIVSLLEK
jgi:uncharacterized protein